MINLLVANERFYQLHQFLQYHVIRDSAHVACLLLSLESKYPPAFQLAIDMLKRLHTREQLIEVLLLKSQVMNALRFARSDSSIKLNPAQFLEAALQSGDSLVRAHRPLSFFLSSCEMIFLSFCRFFSMSTNFSRTKTSLSLGNLISCPRTSARLMHAIFRSM